MRVSHAGAYVAGAGFGCVRDGWGQRHSARKTAFFVTSSSSGSIIQHDTSSILLLIGNLSGIAVLDRRHNFPPAIFSLIRTRNTGSGHRRSWGVERGRDTPAVP